ncbi:t-SNARE VTI1 [Candida viswanathii]|uniref:t-SNARE VTI1 n=1 Tax=Candida viswanathii TaxID=5486 RepID=A0A367Y8Z5_9ASCO|nr:t-SNARE VTI1 [Candida viswanathii]
MSESFATYESEFQLSIQEAQSKISQINSVDAEQRKHYLKTIEGLNEESRELLDQMNIEVSNIPSNQRSSYNSKIRQYKSQLDEAQTTYNTLLDTQDKYELFGNKNYANGAESDQRKQLLSNNSSLERSSQRIFDSQRVALETENIGSNILNDLRSQREQISNSRNTLSQADNYIDKSIQTLKVMSRRLTANKFISYGIIAVLILLIFLVLYSKFS